MKKIENEREYFLHFKNKTTGKKTRIVGLRFDAAMHLLTNCIEICRNDNADAKIKILNLSGEVIVKATVGKGA